MIVYVLMNLQSEINIEKVIVLQVLFLLWLYCKIYEYGEKRKDFFKVIGGIVILQDLLVYFGEIK